jgi:hypothetical protein
VVGAFLVTGTALIIGFWRIDHFFEMKLSGHVTSAEAALLLNQKHKFQLLAIQYSKLRGFDDLNLLGGCPVDCKHEVGLDGVQVAPPVQDRRSQNLTRPA